MNKIPWLIDCYRDLILPGLLGIMIAHSRETYQPTSIMRWDRGIFNGSDDLTVTSLDQWEISGILKCRYRFHIFLAYFLGLCFSGISPQKMALTRMMVRIPGTILTWPYDNGGSITVIQPDYYGSTIWVCQKYGTT